MNRTLSRLSAVREAIASACAAAGRDPAGVRLLAVSKQHPADAVATLYEDGQTVFGENRLREAMGKQDALAGRDIEWHFIGPIQSRKTRDIAARFHWVQSVDRLKVLRRLSEQRPDGLPPLDLCLQVNIDAEPQKSGAAPGDLGALAEAAADLPGVRLRGLMCIPRAGAGPDATRDSFARTRALYEALQAAGHPLDTLSMGMSADIAPAVAEGSTMVRVGTALFGPRP